MLEILLFIRSLSLINPNIRFYQISAAEVQLLVYSVKWSRINNMTNQIDDVY